MLAIELKTDYRVNPIGIDNQSPRFSWKAAGGVEQKAFCLQVLDDERRIFFDSGRVETENMFCVYSGQPLPAAKRFNWQVTLWDETGRQETSEACFEMGLLSVDDWQAKWICGVGTDRCERLPADYYRKSFAVAGQISRARLYATACGIYEARINGCRVEGFVLAPGCTDYAKHLYYQTYDVSDDLQDHNSIEFIVGDGWYKGKIGIDGEECFFGQQTRLLAQLVIDYTDGSRQIIATDRSFEWCNDGPMRYNDLKDGVDFDARLQPSYAFQACEADCTLWPTASPGLPVCEHETFAAKLLTSPSGKQILDFGQNMAGYVRFKICGPAGTELRLSLCEALDQGEYSDKTFVTLPERGKTVRQAIHVVLSGREDHFEPNFFYAGFRYALVEGIARVNPADFTAVAVYSDITLTGRFRCSNPLVTQFVQNTIWGMKSNFIDIPTDCPARERSGWTGDAQIFARTSTYLADTAAFYRKWLIDVRDGQREDGRVRNVCPRIEPDNARSDALNGSVGWADAAVIIPWTLWQMTGDTTFITDNLDLMLDWAHYVMRAAADKRVFDLPPEHPLGQIARANRLAACSDNRYIMEGGVHWGEWAEPLDVLDGLDIMTVMMMPKNEEVAAYTHYSMRLLADMLQTIGRSSDADNYREFAEGARRAYNFHFVRDHDIPSARQAKLVRPLALGLLDPSAADAVARRLNDTAIARDYKVGTGFLSTPFVLKVLADHGYLETAYRMLENTETPGWLAMVRQGATTVWENYEGYDSAGRLRSSSLNHFSPGSVCEFLFSHCAGIRISGNNHLTLQPLPGGTLTWAEAVYDSAFGQVRSRWEKGPQHTEFDIEIPANTRATIILPDQTMHEVGCGQYHFDTNTGGDYGKD